MQGGGSSGNSHVVDLEGAEMMEIRLLSLSTLDTRYQYCGWATNVVMRVSFSDVD